MNNFVDLSGKIFGRWVEILYNKKMSVLKGKASYKCVCECGNIKYVRGTSLTKKNPTKSCGCLAKEVASVLFKKPIEPGTVFTRWTVIKESERNYIGSPRKFYLCWCICGFVKEVEASALRRGISKSCGCLQKQKVKEIGYKNLIDIVGDRFGRGVVLNRNTKIVRKGYRTHWDLICDCGNLYTAEGGNLKDGVTRSCGCLFTETHSGENNNKWKGGITPLTVQIRHTIQYTNWRLAVFERDNYTCQYSCDRGGNLHVHHIKPFYQIIEEYGIVSLEEALACKELWEVSNGVVLNKESHKLFHRIYGNNCTTEDFNNWMEKE